MNYKVNKAVNPKSFFFRLIVAVIRIMRENVSVSYIPIEIVSERKFRCNEQERATTTTTTTTTEAMTDLPQRPAKRETEERDERD